MRKRIFASICCVALGSLLLLCACTVALVYRGATEDGFASLQSSAAYLSAGYRQGGAAFLESAAGTAERITLIDPDGTVLYDNREAAAALPSHADRPEVAGALAQGAGRAQRQSDTFGERQLYYALRLEDGKVLRVSLAAAGILRETMQFVPWLLLISVGIVILASLVARLLTKKMLEPINKLDLAAPLETEAYDELAPLLRRIAAQQGHIAAQMEELGQKQEEFDLVTENMGEGLVVLNRSAQVLSINQSARRIFGVEGPLPPAPPFLTLSRRVELDEPLKKALAGQRQELTLTLDARTYRAIATPTLQDGQAVGAVLLLMDDTERLEAEQRRREFTANVSHELKTPLTSISGYAELIETGLAKGEDVQGFAGRIRAEAGQLVALVEDIIKLSRLDEKDAGLQKEEVDVYALAQGVAKNLAHAAAQRDIALQVTGTATPVRAVRTVLIEVLYNLVDNAIRHGTPGTTVEITVGAEAEPGRCLLRVADEGPGIPAEHRDRIFERFYRVDKSHSKASGGTGLGLSIVKNGALYHGGEVSLQSEVGRGSVFTVSIPLGGNGAN